MYTSILLISILTASVVAAPFAKREENATTATCADSDKMISLVVGPEDAKSVLIHACSAMMPPCAYPETLSNDTVCTAQMNWPLDGPKSVLLNATVERKDNGDKLSGWRVNFTVTPPEQPQDLAGVSWFRWDCEGYFHQLLSETPPDGCLIEGKGSGAGNLTVGGGNLKDTLFDISFAQRGANLSFVDLWG
ncbi:hypothetical protein BU26DRAFT_289559 [Trematosphaeria pertusa]|uniref:Ubiquitin 3 binding protein But2 C-terminal domain-containing protein n=1 Tax=Trematosphaeria pertusa TaxID=390896 RepID=A0A6A6IHX0_9PLEO|nr:uncharacterized protein BU26DRAFT_289559 [Trematosphaeria pertusa]KAF2249799.1 hypothetical protein BU26DRAFT_289559 [Trematosphaeria pertusa]